MDPHPTAAAAVNEPPPLHVRADLDFGFEQDIPRHWFGGDPFKSRFFDAMSTLFPEGERFFIACVRDHCDQITDPELQAATLDFARQEFQHTRVHQAFNARLKAQGVKVDKILQVQRHQLFDLARQHLSRAHTLALTAACEHLTALMAQGFTDRPALFQDADPRVRAMYVWHAIEEVEHKAVAYDVMQKVAGVSWGLRCWALIAISIQFPLITFQILNHMLKVDGYSRGQRLRLWARGLWWLYGPGGLMGPLLRPWAAWFRPGFHPWQQPLPACFDIWQTAFQRHGDPIAASQLLYAGVSASTGPASGPPSKKPGASHRASSGLAGPEAPGQGRTPA